MSPTPPRPLHAGSTTPVVVVGTYVDAQGITNHGFLLNGGQFTTIDYPNATYTEATDINDNGQIVGQYTDHAGKTHGYLYSGGQFTIDRLSEGDATPRQRRSPSPARSRDSTDRATATRHGFLLSNGTYTSIDFPNATDTFIYGLNDLGEIVGRWDDSTGTVHGFYAVKQ